MSRQASPRRTSLRHDQRGLILVVAIPMGALLVGLLWYLASVGDGVLFRERLQDAADATAFENAVLHARGMNVVAMINMLMALLLSVVVALRAAEIVLAAGLVFFGFTAGALTAVIRLDVQIAPKIGKAVGLMNKLEKGVAAATPVMATVMASAGNTTFYRQQEAAAMTVGLSYALFPSELDARVSVDPRDQSRLKPGGGSGANPRMGATLVGGGGARVMPSLPLEDGDYNVLCAHAITFGLTQIVQLAQRFHVPEGIMGPLERALGMFTGLISKTSLTGLFCHAATDLAEQTLSSACDDSQLPDEPPEDEKNGTATSKPTRTKKDAKGDLDTCKDNLGGAMKNGSGNRDEQLPARMWSPAKNGNVIMQTWAIATSGAPKYEDADERGMAIASPSNRPDMHANRVATAQAEYYFSCGDSGISPRWSSCQEQANWALGWSARMRRFWWPLRQADRASDAFSQYEQAFSAIEGFINRGLADLGQGSTTNQVGEGADAALRGTDVYRSLTGAPAEWVH